MRIQNWPHVLSAPRSAWDQHGNNVPQQLGPLQSGPLHQVKLTEPAPEGTGEYPGSALFGAPVTLGHGRQSPDQARELAGWTSGELPGQVNEQLASWPPGMPSAADQPPASA